jgi:hypothetical protein
LRRGIVGLLCSDHARPPHEIPDSPARAERVASRAVEIGALNYKSIASILAHNLDRRPHSSAPGDTVIVHSNIRGPRYFH